MEKEDVVPTLERPGMLIDIKKNITQHNGFHQLKGRTESIITR